MKDAGLTEWRLEPATGGGLPANYVLWAFRLNPYAGGEVRSFASHHAVLRSRRPITVEARRYLNGEYQTLVEERALIEGGSDDPGLAAAITEMTKNLLGPSGAYRHIDPGPNRAGPQR